MVPGRAKANPTHCCPRTTRRGGPCARPRSIREPHEGGHKVRPYGNLARQRSFDLLKRAIRTVAARSTPCGCVSWTAVGHPWFPGRRWSHGGEAPRGAPSSRRPGGVHAIGANLPRERRPVLRRAVVRRPRSGPAASVVGAADRTCGAGGRRSTPPSPAARVARGPCTGRRHAGGSECARPRAGASTSRYPQGEKERNRSV